MVSSLGALNILKSSSRISLPIAGYCYGGIILYGTWEINRAVTKVV